MNALLSIWTWLEVALVALVGFFIQLTLFILTFLFDKRRYVAGRCFRLVGVTAAKLTPFWRFGVHGNVPDRVAPNTVVVSNHESNADCFLISFLPWEMKWLGKRSLFKVPVVGWMMSLAGDVSVERGDRDSATGAMARCKEWMLKGMPVMIFPEGTRSKTDELLPFKDGAFRLAIEMQADVLPLAVSGTRLALPKHSWRFATSRGLVTVGTPISTKGMTMDDVESLKNQARAQIEALRASLKPLTGGSASVSAADANAAR
ncbi:1-acyl-sn-glycerol-3-phosphate acyltransferase [Corallococcus sp. AB004]|uniref:lysophospholipid acyltransferase family protein n=1 Tax=Corallococcus TaxID=83461 RepID=UPI000EA1B965|nr:MULTISPECIES: lysophospholipid acyltransferase family protein [Corallococcus]RKI32416.1 1-acyl-sn-glycerol-3-phosphate acyltransferase [Corallococcus sp. AB004]NPC70249.1 1-acyl-sn-glycerol-3-phosphate acyltransferase [Corallococcus exiguus]NPD28889.1 1-acyl-sn-glycerol-3-phosphate acyltransferase [Corallococcus exiguus]NRD49458.1 1-acyl-sn-glycerol-3-phosphate acyltransferase [Corallococcus exiguus]RKH96456.1 1-acyl-sn-glycerol-3-phosphate acyltransferase [Corallococcus sp. AB038B]